MNCVIIDDDELSRSVLQQFIAKTGEIEIKESFSDPVKALQYLRENDADLIFLDVEMPEMNGLEFLGSLNDRIPEVILTTSHEKFALVAFEHKVTDFLLKPVRYPRFLKAIEKVKEMLSRQTIATEAGTNSFFIKKGSSIVRINISDVVWVEALGDYVTLNTIDHKKFVVHTTMKDIENKLPPKDYIRVHRSFIVRIDKIDSIEDSTISYHEKLIPIGKSYKEEVLKRIGVL